MDPNGAATEEKLTLPAEWPGAFKAYKYSKQAVILNISPILILLILSYVITFGFNLTIKNRVYSNLIGIFVETLIAAITTPVLIASVRQQKITLGEAINKGINFWPKIFALTLLVDLSLLLSTVALIIPVFFVWPRLILVNYFLVDKDMSVMDAYKASWHATKQHVGFIYGIVGAEIAMGLLIITIVGIPFSIYFLIMYSAVHAMLYEVITKQLATSPVKN